MKDLKTLRNTSTVAQSVVFKGQQFTLSPHDEQTYEVDVADKFIEFCSPVVVDVSADTMGSMYAPELIAKTVWLANVTGNPDSPSTVTVTTRPPPATPAPHSAQSHNLSVLSSV
jgi:hypothetical protein